MSKPDSVERANFLAASYPPIDLARRLVAQEELRDADARRNDAAWRTMRGERDVARREVDRLREANVALRQALVLIEDHALLDARERGFVEASRYSAIARDAINENQ